MSLVFIWVLFKKGCFREKISILSQFSHSSHPSWDVTVYRSCFLRKSSELKYIYDYCSVHVTRLSFNFKIQNFNYFEFYKKKKKHWRLRRKRNLRVLSSNCANAFFAFYSSSSIPTLSVSRFWCIFIFFYFFQYFIGPTLCTIGRFNRFLVVEICVGIIF